MSGWATLGVFLAAVISSLVVFCTVAYWPQRPPKDRTVDDIRKRIERDEGE